MVCLQFYIRGVWVFVCDAPSTLCLTEKLHYQQFKCGSLHHTGMMKNKYTQRSPPGPKNTLDRGGYPFPNVHSQSTGWFRL